MWKHRVRPQKHMQTRWKLSGVLHVLRRRRMRKREKCQSGTAGKTHSEGPWVLHCSLVVSYIKIWVGFPFFTLCCCCFWPAAVEWATRDKTRVGERERKNRKIYFSWLWKSNSQLDFNFVCVCLSVPFFGRLSLRCLALSASVPLAANFDLPSMATAAAICAYM